PVGRGDPPAAPPRRRPGGHRRRPHPHGDHGRRTRPARPRHRAGPPCRAPHRLAPRRSHLTAPTHLVAVPAPAGTSPTRPPEPDGWVSCHRRRRGPYTGGGSLLRDHVVPDLLDHAPHLLERHPIEILALAPELAGRVP